MLIYADRMTRHIGLFQSCLWDRVLCQLAGKYHWSVWQGTQFWVSLIQRPILLPDAVPLGFGFKLIIILQKSMRISFRDRVLQTVRCRDEKVKKVKKYLLMVQKITAAYVFIASSSRFSHSLTGLVNGGEECGAMTEMTPRIVSCVAVRSFMTLRLQLDLVLNDMAATVSHNLFSQCSVILHMVTQRCGQNLYSSVAKIRTAPQNTIFMQHFAWPLSQQRSFSLTVQSYIFCTSDLFTIRLVVLM